MATFGDYSLKALGALRAELQTLASDCLTLQIAGQRSVGRLYEEFEESLVLARLFVTLPFGFLPEREQAFARRVAEKRGVLAELTEDTTVVTLLASRGANPQWNDPSNSRDHLAIPLLSASFVQTIPIVGRLLSGVVTEVSWLTKQQTLMMRESMGKMSQVICVEDARTARTGDGHVLVTAQNFVQDNGVRSVVAVGGRYLNGTALALVLFTREQLTEDQVSKFATIVNTLKAATMKIVMDCKIL